VELFVQFALFLVIWRIKILPPAALKNYVCGEHEIQMNTLHIVGIRNSIACDVLETHRMVLNTLLIPRRQFTNVFYFLDSSSLWFSHIFTP
jgi:hypothetical protein